MDLSYCATYISPHDVRKCVWSIQHVMPCRQATFGMTIENATTRVWFCCRSSVIVSDAFNFIAVRVFLRGSGGLCVIRGFDTFLKNLRLSLNSLPRSRSQIRSPWVSILP
jgi:hypothetical protein